MPRFASAYLIASLLPAPWMCSQSRPCQPISPPSNLEEHPVIASELGAVSRLSAGTSALRLLSRQGLGRKFAGLIAMWLASSLAGCTLPGDSSLFTSEDSPFVVTAVSLSGGDAAAAQPVNPVLTVTFSDFPDPQSVTFPALRLGTRTSALEYLYRIELAERRVVLWPKVDLLPENDYYVSVSTQARSLSGQALAVPSQVRFRTSSYRRAIPPPQPAVTLQSLLDDVLRPRCASAGCHAGGSSKQAARGLDFSLSAAEVRRYLISTQEQSSHRSLLLVEPGAPERSALLRKILMRTGFTGSAGEPMPPLLFSPLPPEAISLLEHWIWQGAR
jgi:hypothetical protein